jgi:hypothetical protein
MDQAHTSTRDRERIRQRVSLGYIDLSGIRSGALQHTNGGVECAYPAIRPDSRHESAQLVLNRSRCFAAASS